MSRYAAATELLRLTSGIVSQQAAQRKRQQRYAITKAVAERQFVRVEEGLARALMPVFQAQIGAAVRGLEQAAKAGGLWVKGYNPQQPRHPAGTPQGGQWASQTSGPSPGIVNHPALTTTEEEYRGPWVTAEEWAKDETAAAAKAETARQREHEWRTVNKIAISEGITTYEEAAKRGFYLDASQRPKPMPKHLWHVTTAASAVAADGELKSRAALGMGLGHGLGGGAEDTISFTDNPKIAAEIHDALVEAHQVANGKITIADMLEQAKTGDGANRPWLDRLIHQGAYSVAGRPDWKQGDELPLPWQKLTEGKKVENAMGFPKTTEYIAGVGGEPIGEGLVGGDGQTRYFSWSRPMTDDERLQETFGVYKTFSYYRDDAGGPMDPLFFTSDPKALAAKDINDIQVLQVDVPEGHMGHQVSALGEWRSFSGRGMRLTPVPRQARTQKSEYGYLTKLYNPAQPRVPAGRPEGGQWTTLGNGPTVSVNDNPLPALTRQEELQTLGYLRETMPQVRGPDKPEFFAWLTEQGIGYRRVQKPAGELRGMQADYNAEKVAQMVDTLREGGSLGNTPVLGSMDGYIADGHHRWRAQYEYDPTSLVEVDEVDLPAQALLDTIKQFPKHFIVGVDEPLRKEFDVIEYDARQLIEKVFRPQLWWEPTVDRALPVLARGMSEAAVAQLLTVGVDMRRKGYNPQQPRHPAGTPQGGQWAGGQTSTPEFKAWFKDSKVVDANGKPLVVYHGSADDFSSFDFQDLGDARPNAAFFSDSPEVAAGYAAGMTLEEKREVRRYNVTYEAREDYGNGLFSRVNRNLPERDSAVTNGLNELLDSGKITREEYDRFWELDDALQDLDREASDIVRQPSIRPVYLRITNPHIVEANGLPWDAVVPSTFAAVDRTKHDGIIFRNLVDNADDAEYTSTTYAVFSPTQIKSALANSGAFDPNNPDITKSYGGRKSTATDWLDRSGEALPPGVLAELPEWLKVEIAEQLRAAFAQPYWRRIAETTRDDILKFLEDGLQTGWSILRMAREIETNFTESYCRSRAVNVARTEAGNALNGARRASMDALVDEMPPEVAKYIRPSWLSVLGTTTRPAHADLDGVPADNEGLFNLNGVRVPWPGHWSLPAKDRCNCFPADTLVSGDFEGAQRAWYEGKLAEIITVSGGRLTVTPNHPIMTSKGLVPAGLLNPGQKVLSYKLQTDCAAASASGGAATWVGAAGGDEIQHKPAAIEQVFEAFLAGAVSGSCGTVEVRVPDVNDFYGDGKSLNGDIEIVRTNWKLLKDGNIAGFQKSGDFVLHLMNVEGAGVPSLGAGGFDGPGIAATPASVPSVPKPGHLVPLGSITPAGTLAVGVAANFDASLKKDTTEDTPADSRFLSEALERHATSVFLDEIVSVRFFDFVGHVYDLQSSRGHIVATAPGMNIGIVTSNCQCTLVQEFGMGEEEAMQLIAEHAERVAEGKNYRAGRYTLKAWGHDGASLKGYNPGQPRHPAGTSQGGQWVGSQTDSPAFKAWFGDSKVVDENGGPLVVYHGTAGDFNEFKTGTVNAWSDTLGFDTYFFSADRATASTYAGQFENGKVKEVYLSIQNPLEIDANGGEWYDAIAAASDQIRTYRTPEEFEWLRVSDEYRQRFGYELEYEPDAIPQEARAAFEASHRSLERHILENPQLYFESPRKPYGYDGVIVKNVYDMTAAPVAEDIESYSPFTTVYIPFKPTQIKSATGNSGAFDPNNPDITKGYNPNQPRHPAGTPQGGEWSGGDAAPLNSEELNALALDPERIYDSKLRARSMQAVEEYAGIGYAEINEELRVHPDKWPMRPGYKRVRDFNTAFDLLSNKTPRDITVYRAVEDMGHILKPGTKFIDDGYSSTTAHRDYAEDFLRGEDNVQVLAIKVPQGTHVLAGDDYLDPGEVVLKYGTQLRVGEVNADGHLELEVIGNRSQIGFKP